MMTTDDLIRIGFKPIEHFTITNSHVYDLGRHRHISVGDVGTPNEMMWISETDDIDSRIINELINLHNYDYDGFLTEDKVLNIINTIK